MFRPYHNWLLINFNEIEKFNSLLEIVTILILSQLITGYSLRLRLCIHGLFFPVTVVIFTARKLSLRRLCFYLSVSHSVHRGEVPGQIPPGRYTPPWQVHTPLAGTPLGRYTPPPPGQGHPQAVHAGIRSTSGRYAS